MRSNDTKRVALGGVLAAVAVVIMSLGGLIPVATYVCPLLCAMTQFVVLRFCGNRIAWCWFSVVSILVILLSPDKEAAMVFIALGYYPLIKHRFESSKLRIFWKTLYFNISVLFAYFVIIYVLGMQEVAAENNELGMIGLVIILLLGNVTFFLMDRLLTIMARKLR